MLQQAEVIDKLSCSVGDYNVITSTEKKLGGIPYDIKKILDFIAIIEAYDLMDMGFSGQK